MAPSASSSSVCEGVLGRESASGTTEGSKQLIKVVITAILTLFMTFFWLVLVPLIPLYSLFLLTFPFYFIHWIILDHSDILLDFRSILIEFLAHMLSPCFLVFLLQV